MLFPYADRIMCYDQQIGCAQLSEMATDSQRLTLLPLDYVTEAYSKSRGEETLDYRHPSS